MKNKRHWTRFNKFNTDLCWCRYVNVHNGRTKRANKKLKAAKKHAASLQRRIESMLNFAFLCPQIGVHRHFDLSNRRRELCGYGNSGCGVKIEHLCNSNVKFIIDMHRRWYRLCNRNAEVIVDPGWCSYQKSSVYVTYSIDLRLGW